MRISLAQITNQRPFLLQFDRPHRAEALAGAASGAQVRINVNLTERTDPDGLCRALRTVPLFAGLADHGIVKAQFFQFDDLNAAGAPPHFSRVEKGAVDLAPPAS